MILMSFPLYLIDEISWHVIWSFGRIRGFPTLVSPMGRSCVKVRDDLEDVRIASILMDANSPLHQSYTSTS